jgi:ferredoxin
MLVHYGYTDASGDYRISIDQDECDGCGKCVEVCPEELFMVEEDDYDREVAMIKDDLIRKLGYLCPGYERCKSNIGDTCQEVCPHKVISHSW